VRQQPRVRGTGWVCRDLPGVLCHAADVWPSALLQPGRMIARPLCDPSMRPLYATPLCDPSMRPLCDPSTATRVDATSTARARKTARVARTRRRTCPACLDSSATGMREAVALVSAAVPTRTAAPFATAPRPLSASRSYALGVVVAVRAARLAYPATTAPAKSATPTLCAARAKHVCRVSECTVCFLSLFLAHVHTYATYTHQANAKACRSSVRPVVLSPHNALNNFTAVLMGAKLAARLSRARVESA
jgi:hypothetical protein